VAKAIVFVYFMGVKDSRKELLYIMKAKAHLQPLYLCMGYGLGIAAIGIVV